MMSFTNTSDIQEWKEKLTTHPHTNSSLQQTLINYSYKKNFNYLSFNQKKILPIYKYNCIGTRMLIAFSLHTQKKKMGTTHCLRHGFILVLVLFLSSISCLDSKVEVSYDTRGIKIKVDRERILSYSIPNPRSEFGRSLPKLGNQIPVCIHQNRSRAPVLMFDCNEKGYVFTKINFADYGHASGDCGDFRRGNCGAPDTLRLVKKVTKLIYIINNM